MRKETLAEILMENGIALAKVTKLVRIQRSRQIQGTAATELPGPWRTGGAQHGVPGFWLANTELKVISIGRQSSFFRKILQILFSDVYPLCHMWDTQFQMFSEYFTNELGFQKRDLGNNENLRIISIKLNIKRVGRGEKKQAAQGGQMGVSGRLFSPSLPPSSFPFGCVLFSCSVFFFKLGEIWTHLKIDKQELIESEKVENGKNWKVISWYKEAKALVSLCTQDVLSLSWHIVGDPKKRK